jgi:hypothetical protein
LPVTGHGTASAALLGGCLELSLEGCKLGERRIGISLLLALTMRGEVATFFIVAPALREIRPLAAPAVRVVPQTFGTMLRAMLARASLAAVFAVAPEFTLRTARSTMLRALLFGGHNRLAGGPGAVFRSGWSFGFCSFSRRAFGRQLAVGLVCTLPLRRAPLAAPFLAAAAWPPDLDKFSLCWRRGRLRRDSGSRKH